METKFDGAPCEVKVSRTVWVGGKSGDNLKGLPIDVIIESTIDCWTREKRQNNIVINDPKGELLCRFYVPATVRGYEVVQFNLMNVMKTDIYNPLGYAADRAREGDFTKCGMYITNIGDVFFPVDNADEPMWPNAANNAFKRSAYGMIDYFVEEEKELRREATRSGMDNKVLMQKLDDMWGKVTLYNVYQMMILLAKKKSKDAQFIKFDEQDPVSEKDFLTLFFDATAILPLNTMRTMVQNADASLRAMAQSEKTIASVYGISLTAMSFFADPTISSLTSGRPSQNFDAEGLSFPRRLGVKFAPEYLARHKLVGLQCVWESYSDKDFKHKLDDKIFGHSGNVDLNGWARYYFDGKYKDRKNYVKLKVMRPDSGLLVKEFFFELELSYRTDLRGKSYVKDPILGTKIIKDGVLREMVRVKDKKTGDMSYKFGQTCVETTRMDIYDDDLAEEVIKIPAFDQMQVRYTEKPRIIFAITPPHLQNYAKLILVLLNQMVEMNLEPSYMVKGSQKPLYKTNYMLDEVGNLSSEGKGIPGLQTKLSIGLGQSQSFTLILQTMQQRATSCLMKSQAVCV